MIRTLHQLRRRYIKPWVDPVALRFRHLRLWRVANLAGIEVYYKRHLQGGGLSFGQGYIPLLEALGVPRLPRVFEWCAGPGFIGFSMLGHKLCDTLCLADINPEAVAACRRTIRANNLANRVTVYLSDNLRTIPRSERWDLVVSNPPHFADQFAGNLLAHDPGWRLHREFFAAVEPFLKPGGVIVLQEQNAGSTAETFRPMIEQAGLSVAFVIGGEPQRTAQSRLYFIGIMRPGDARPDWVRRAAASSR
jgi:hypothetical protein